MNVNESKKLSRHLTMVYVNICISCISTTSGIQASFYLTNVLIVYLPLFLSLFWLISIIIAIKTSNSKLQFSLLFASAFLLGLSIGLRFKIIFLILELSHDVTNFCKMNFLIFIFFIVLLLFSNTIITELGLIGRFVISMYVWYSFVNFGWINCLNYIIFSLNYYIGWFCVLAIFGIEFNILRHYNHTLFFVIICAFLNYIIFAWFFDLDLIGWLCLFALFGVENHIYHLAKSGSCDIIKHTFFLFTFFALFHFILFGLVNSKIEIWLTQ